MEDNCDIIIIGAGIAGTACALRCARAGLSVLLLEPRQPGGCKLKTAPVRPVVAARPAEYVCSEDLFY
ncbi:FAD-binding protein [Escherichia coli]|nr:hypothetical protein C1I39_12065 [Escherichia coli]PNC02722.1 hypothetical protein C1I42_08335 [Escherichia coli]PWH50347.1 FAD-binding protein [Escherichia coli]